MEFYDGAKQLDHRETADELYRFASRLRDGLHVEPLPKDAADLLGSSERDRLIAFYRRRMTNRRIEELEVRMAREVFDAIGQAPVLSCLEAADPMSTVQNQSDVAS